MLPHVIWGDVLSVGSPGTSSLASSLEEDHATVAQATRSASMPDSLAAPVEAKLRNIHFTDSSSSGGEANTAEAQAQEEHSTSESDAHSETERGCQGHTSCVDVPVQAPAQGPAPEFPSIGSQLHHAAQCRPCRWFWTEDGCRSGHDCTYCHLCGPDVFPTRAAERKRERAALWHARRLSLQQQQSPRGRNGFHTATAKQLPRPPTGPPPLPVGLLGGARNQAHQQNRRLRSSSSSSTVVTD
mmetsp:Transcript_1616/g.3516  ORF Transcript_1616/g.3516 Transcript_1616/m.3516 type:complete len:242 (-) Transcript_1616:116-841(-)